jgi:hypothetical protein
MSFLTERQQMKLLLSQQEADAAAVPEVVPKGNKLKRTASALAQAAPAVSPATAAAKRSAISSKIAKLKDKAKDAKPGRGGKPPKAGRGSRGSKASKEKGPTAKSAYNCFLEARVGELRAEAAAQVRPPILACAWVIIVVPAEDTLHLAIQH